MSSFNYCINNPLSIVDFDGRDTTMVINGESVYVLNDIEVIGIRYSIQDANSTSSRGKQFIKRHEGFRPYIYKDVANKATIGYGHLIIKDQMEKYQNGISNPEADALFLKDLQEMENAINALVSRPLTQNEFDALASFVFNYGPTKFSNSHLLMYINSNRIDKIRHEFSRWNKANKNGVWETVPGLTKRRAEEANLFLNGNY